MRTSPGLLLRLLSLLAIFALGGCASSSPQQAQAKRSSLDPRFQQVQDENEIHGEVGAYYGHAGR